MTQYKKDGLWHDIILSDVIFEGKKNTSSIKPFQDLNAKLLYQLLFQMKYVTSVLLTKDP